MFARCGLGALYVLYTAHRPACLFSGVVHGGAHVAFSLYTQRQPLGHAEYFLELIGLSICEHWWVRYHVDNFHDVKFRDKIIRLNRAIWGVFTCVSLCVRACRLLDKYPSLTCTSQTAQT